MPVDTLHPEHAAWSDRWQTVRDVIAGEHAIHAGGERYLPRLTEQPEAAYQAYVKRAGWYAATARTLQGLVGMVLRKAPALTAPDALVQMAGSIGIEGQTADQIAAAALGDVLAVGRYGMLAEYPQAAGTVVTAAQAAASGRKGYLTTWPTETIRNWRQVKVGNRMVTTLIVLDETAHEDDGDPYKPQDVKQLRVLSLDDGRRYVQRIFRRANGGEWAQFGDDIIPLRDGAPLAYIPFVGITPGQLTICPAKPPLLDLASLNVSHYRNTADLEHGAHLTGIPTPVVTGHHAEENETFAIGSDAWVFPNPQARAHYLEFTGTGLRALEDRCKAKEAQMAALGARMLAPEKTGVESGEALAMRHSGEQSYLASVATVVSAGMAMALRFVADWEGISGDVDYELSTDYTPSGMTAQQLTALVGAWQSGAISEQELFWNLKSGEMIPADKSYEDHVEEVRDGGPNLGTLTPPDPIVV